jgi:hypothetical protein
VEAPLADLPDTIRYYLEHDDLRAELVERAHTITTGDQTMGCMVRKIMHDTAEHISPQRQPASH